jgi:hypothetical protein
LICSHTGRLSQLENNSDVAKPTPSVKGEREIPYAGLPQMVLNNREELGKHEKGEKFL